HLDSLKEVFVWNTKITSAEAKGLQANRQNTVFNIGYIADDKEMLQLTPPIVKNEEFILNKNENVELKHKFPGVTIRYTFDGSDPDSTTSPVYDHPITINKYSRIKAKAVLSGWYSSPVSSFLFIKKGLKPTNAELINQPDEKYKQEGIKTL